MTREPFDSTPKVIIQMNIGPTNILDLSQIVFFDSVNQQWPPVITGIASNPVSGYSYGNGTYTLSSNLTFTFFLNKDFRPV